jgi:hypothetical protein
MYGRTELVPVRVFGQAVHVGAVFPAVINKAETVWNNYMTNMRRNPEAFRPFSRQLHRRQQ